MYICVPDLELAELHLQHVLAGGQTENSREEFGVGLHLKHTISLLTQVCRAHPETQVNSKYVTLVLTLLLNFQ